MGKTESCITVQYDAFFYVLDGETFFCVGTNKQPINECWSSTYLIQKPPGTWRPRKSLRLLRRYIRGSYPDRFKSRLFILSIAEPIVNHYVHWESALKSKEYEITDAENQSGITVIYELIQEARLAVRALQAAKQAFSMTLRQKRITYGNESL